MASLTIQAPFFLLITINLCLRVAYGDYGGGWVNAHATFYGGGDASGTMGNYILPL